MENNDMVSTMLRGHNLSMPRLAKFYIVAECTIIMKALDDLFALRADHHRIVPGMRLHRLDAAIKQGICFDLARNSG